MFKGLSKQMEIVRCLLYHLPFKQTYIDKEQLLTSPPPRGRGKVSLKIPKNDLGLSAYTKATADFTS